MEYKTGKKLISGAGLAALILVGGGAATGENGGLGSAGGAAESMLEKITSPVLKEQIKQIQYQEQKEEKQYLRVACCMNHCECCVCGESEIKDGYNNSESSNGHNNKVA